MSVFAIVINRHKELFQKHRYFISIVWFLVYLAFGAFMFLAMEGDEFEEGQRAVLEAKDKIRKKYPEVSGKSNFFLMIY